MWVIYYCKIVQGGVMKIRQEGGGAKKCMLGKEYEIEGRYN